MTETAAATFRNLHGAAAALVQDDVHLAFAVRQTLALATSSADDDHAGQDDVSEEAWADTACNALTCILCDDSAPAVRAWFLSQGFTF